MRKIYAEYGSRWRKLKIKKTGIFLTGFSQESIGQRELRTRFTLLYYYYYTTVHIIWSTKWLINWGGIRASSIYTWQMSILVGHNPHIHNGSFIYYIITNCSVFKYDITFSFNSHANQIVTHRLATVDVADASSSSSSWLRNSIGSINVMEECALYIAVACSNKNHSNRANNHELYNIPEYYFFYCYCIHVRTHVLVMNAFFLNVLLFSFWFRWNCNRYWLFNEHDKINHIHCFFTCFSFLIHYECTLHIMSKWNCW